MFLTKCERLEILSLLSRTLGAELDRAKKIQKKLYKKKRMTCRNLDLQRNLRNSKPRGPPKIADYTSGAYAKVRETCKLQKAKLGRMEGLGFSKWHSET